MHSALDKDLFWSTAVPIDKESLRGLRNCVVMVPHADDESLGCAGLISMLREMGTKLTVILTTDGSKSHPHSKKYPADRLAALRLREIKDAMKILGLGESALIHYDAPDAQMPTKGENGFNELRDKLKKDLINLSPDLLLVPYEMDPHCDHRATFQLLISALEIAHIPRPRIFEYPIWLYENAAPEDLPLLQIGELLSVDITAYLETKQRCIYAHRSQTTRLIDDDPDGFILTDNVIANFIQQHEYFLERKKINPEDSLSKTYFEKMYSADQDPWNFEGSAYEKEKYQNTIRQIPLNSYKSALEIGCSIGVLTAMLAEQCVKLIAMDISETALSVAKKRLKKNQAVEFRLGAIPEDYPEESFDLIILSEVGYYLSWNDLLISKERIIDSLNEKGILVLVHWIHFVADYPLTGDQVHNCFLDSDMVSIHSSRYDDYRMDILQKA